MTTQQRTSVGSYTTGRVLKFTAKHHHIKQSEERQVNQDLSKPIHILIGQQQKKGKLVIDVI